MKLNKIEKIIVVIIVIGLILGIGIFVFVKPSYEQIGKEQKTLDGYNTELAALKEKLSRLDTIDADINEQKDLAKEYEDHFYPELTTYETSEIAMAYLAAANLEAHEISISSISTRSISLSYFMPSSIQYTIKSLANTANTDPDTQKEVLEEGQFKDGNKIYSVTVNSLSDIVIADENGEAIAPAKYTDTMKKVYKAALCKAASSGGISQTTAATQASYTVKGTYKDYMDFIDHIYSLKRATTVPSVVIPMTHTPDKEEEDVGDYFVDESGRLVPKEEVTENQEVVVEDDTIIEQPLTLIFLSIDPINAPSNLDIEGEKIVVDQRPAVY